MVHPLTLGILSPLREFSCSWVKRVWLSKRRGRGQELTITICRKVLCGRDQVMWLNMTSYLSPAEHSLCEKLKGSYTNRGRRAEWVGVNQLQKTSNSNFQARSPSLLLSWQPRDGGMAWYSEETVMSKGEHNLWEHWEIECKLRRSWWSITRSPSIDSKCTVGGDTKESSAPSSIIVSFPVVTSNSQRTGTPVRITSGWG